MNKYVEELVFALDKQPIINKAEEVWQEKEIERTNDLLSFVEDFINSEEYLQYIEKKLSIIKDDKSTQCNADDISKIEVVIEEVFRNTQRHLENESNREQYPLTQRSKAFFAFARQFEIYKRNEENAKILKKQENAIKIIREKIFEMKSLFLKRLSVASTKEKQKCKYLLEFSKHAGIDLSKISKNVRVKVLEKVVNYNKMTKQKKCNTHQKWKHILKKLKTECKRQLEIDKIKNKRYDYKVKRKEKIMKDMVVRGNKIILSPRPGKKLVEKIKEEEIVKEKETSIVQEEVKIDEIVKDVKVKKDEKQKKKDEKTSKALKKGKDKELEFELPLVPITNQRKKIQINTLKKVTDLLKEFEEFEEILEDKRFIKNLFKEVVYPSDNSLICTPECICFNGISNGMVYRKRINVLNRSSKVKKCRILKKVFKDPYDEVFFEIQPMGVQKLIPGCSFNIQIVFHPNFPLKIINGKLVFLLYEPGNPQYFQFEIEISCLPAFSNLTFYPETIDFGRIPFWKAKKQTKDIYKIIKLKNTGKKSCKVVLKKLENTQTNILEENARSSVIDDECFIKNVLEKCFENTFNKFHFESHFFDLDEKQEKLVKIYFYNYEYIGYYFEKYVFDIYEHNSKNELEIVGSREIGIEIEVVGHFISVEPTTLDFGVCIYNTSYQLNFEIKNSSNIIQALSVKFPSSLSNIIFADASTFFIQPQERRIVWLKFIPRHTISKDNYMYFDKSTNILEFPVYVTILTKNHNEIPNVKVIIFAILTEMDDLVLIPKDVAGLNYSENSKLMLDLGQCNTSETRVATILLENKTEQAQLFSFVDIPEYAAILPNFGFGEILPKEIKSLKLYILPNFNDLGDLMEKNVSFTLTVQTVSLLGQLKTSMNQKSFRRSIDICLKELNTNGESNLMKDMIVLLNALKKSNDNLIINFENKNDDDVKENNEDLNSENILYTKSIDILAKIKKPLCEFNYQVIQFQDTACGSYSTAEIILKAVFNNVNNKNKNKTLSELEGHFRIRGDSNEIQVQPNCGIICNGEQIKLTLIVKPNIPEEVVYQSAKFLKKRELYKKKIEELEMKRQQEIEKELNQVKDKTKKDKKVKEKNDKTKSGASANKEAEPNEYCPPWILVEDKEVVVGVDDLYPAEMYYWTTMKPYHVNGRFTCKITYENGERYYPNDTLYFEAVCKVVAPDFITNLTSQTVNFGAVFVGMQAFKSIYIQNIKDKNIVPKIEDLSPMGHFSVHKIENTILPPQHLLNIPLIFSPKQDGLFQEFLNIRSGNTVCTLHIIGEGINANLTISPPFQVFRIESSEKDIFEISLEIINKTNAAASIRLDKVCEIEGFIKEIEKPKEENIKSSKKEKIVDNKKSKNKKPTSVNSNELTEDEIDSINKYFEKIKGKSNFDYIIAQEDNSKLVIEKNSKNSLRIRFGKFELLEETRKQDIKQSDKKGGKTSKTKDNLKGSKKSPQKIDDKSYIVKYNILLGSHFVKDIIIIAKFI